MTTLMRTALSAALLAALALQAASEEPKPRDPIDALHDRHRRRLEKLRGLKFEKEPEIRYWSEEKLKEMLTEDFDRELPESRARAIQVSLGKFGLVPKEWDLRSEYLEVLLEQVNGLYHPKSKALCLIAGKVAGDAEDLLIVHELDHAMQDQHFDLTRLMALVEKNDDMTFALKALIEGEATFIMLDHLVRLGNGDRSGAEEIADADLDRMLGKGGSGSGRLDAAPAYVRESLLRTYADGAKWCLSLKKAGGWEKLNAAWADLPASSEQILHPEKYTKRDMPQAVTLAAPAALEGWTVLDQNCMGELGVMMLFMTLKPKSPQSGRDASEGWDGDWYRVYEKGPETLLAWGTTWDSEQDAREFAVAYAQLLKTKHAPDLDATEADATPFVAATPRGAVALTMSGRHVYVVEGGSTGTAAAAMKSLVEGTEFAEMKPGIGKK